MKAAARSLFSLGTTATVVQQQASALAGHHSDKASVPRDHLVDSFIERLVSTELNDPSILDQAEKHDTARDSDSLPPTTPPSELVREIEDEVPELSLSLLASNIRKLNARYVICKKVFIVDAN